MNTRQRTTLSQFLDKYSYRGYQMAGTRTSRRGNTVLTYHYECTGATSGSEYQFELVVSPDGIILAEVHLWWSRYAW